MHLSTRKRCNLIGYYLIFCTDSGIQFVFYLTGSVDLKDQSRAPEEFQRVFAYRDFHALLYFKSNTLKILQMF